MTSSADTARILAELASRGPVSRWPRTLVDTCREATAVTGAGLAVLSSEGLGGALAATEGAAQRMEDLQFALGEGPCREATRSGSPVLVPDLRETEPTRWPAFTPAAIEDGVLAAFAFPLRVGGTAVGVLDLYRASGGALTEPQLVAAASYAEAATAVLLLLQDAAAPPEQHDNTAAPATPLADVFARRAVVLQAAGMISVQLGTTPDAALVRLRAHAFSTERSILDVAADVVARRMRFDHSDTGTTMIPWAPPGAPDPSEGDR